MKRTLLIFSFLNACATGPTESEVNQNLAESSAKYSAWARTWEERFFTCVTEYAQKHSRAKFSSREIAEASIANCRHPNLTSAVALRIDSMRTDSLANGRTAREIDAIHAETELRGAVYRDDLLEQARQRAIQVLVNRK